MERLARNRAGVWERIDGALRACGRPPGSVRLVCVTKSVTPDVAAALFETGERDFGENRIDELERKQAHFDAQGLEVRWHWLGHIQSRKARRVLRAADVIHSLDSEGLFDQLERLGAEENRLPGLFLQVKLTAEESKTGLTPEAVAGLAARVAASDFPLLGLMAMAPTPPTEAERDATAHRAFSSLAQIAGELPGDFFENGKPQLSMGMSADIDAAIRAGSDLVRIGTALFEGLAPRAERSTG